MKLTFLRGLSLIGVQAWATVAYGQSVLGTETPAQLVPPGLRAAVNSSQFVLPGNAAELTTPLQWGTLEAKPHFSDRFVYSDGLQASLGHPLSTHINSLSAGVLLDIGSHWTLDYNPTWIAYSNHAFKNSVDQSLKLVGAGEIGDWLAQFGQDYSSTNSTRIETGRQTKEEVSSTSLSLIHRFNGVLSIQLGGVQDLHYIELSPNYYDWYSEDWLVYRVNSRLEYSVGCRLGYTDYSPGSYLTSSRYQARVQWRMTDLVTLSAQGGREHREFHKHGVPAQDSPAVSASLQYRPFDHTLLNFSASQMTTPSYFANSVIENKGWNAELQQRLLGKLNFTAGYSRMKAHYFGSHTDLVPSYTIENVLDGSGNVIGTITHVTYTPTTVLDLRDDTTRSYHFRLSTPLLKRGTVALLYERNHNTSSIAGYSFTSTQVGCEIGYRF